MLGKVFYKIPNICVLSQKKKISELPHVDYTILPWEKKRKICIMLNLEISVKLMLRNFEELSEVSESRSKLLINIWLLIFFL